MRFILLTIAVLFTLNLEAQQMDRFKDNRNIYLLDVTLSMWGKSAGATDIFDEVRSELKKVINATGNVNTEIVVVTFQDEIINTWEAKATPEGKRYIIEELNKISSNNVPKQNTNIFRAWERGRELLDPNKLNVMFLLTDGEHSVHHTPKSRLYREVQDWENHAVGKDYYAFLVELTSQAMDTELRNIIQKTKNAQIISGIEFFVLGVEENEPVINLNDALSFNFNLVGDRINALPEDFSFTIKSTDSRFDIRHMQPIRVQDGMRRVVLEPLKPIEDLKREMGLVSEVEFLVEYDEERFPQIKILNQKITCTVKNEKEMVLTIEVAEND